MDCKEVARFLRSRKGRMDNAPYFERNGDIVLATQPFSPKQS